MEETSIPEVPPTPLPEKKPNNNIKLIIPIAVLVVLVVILVGVAFISGNLGAGNGKKEIAKAVVETYTESQKAIKKVWGLDEYKDMFEDRQMSLLADLNVEGVDVEMEYNMNDKISGIYMDIGYWGSSLIEAVFYVDEEEISLGVPNLTDYVLYVDRTTLEKDIYNLVEEGMLDEETAEALITINQGSQDIEEGADSEIRQGALDIVNKAKEIYNDTDVKKTSSKKLEVNGSERDCKGYVITVTAPQIEAFFLKYKEVYEENEAFQNYFNQFLTLETGFDTTEEMLAYLDPAEELKELADGAAKEKKKYEIYVYLYDGVVAQLYFEENEDNYLEWNIKGGSFPLENMELKFVTGGEENYFSRSGSIEKDIYTVTYAVEIAYEELYLDLEYDRDSGDIDISLYDYYNDLTLNGNLDKKTPGSELVIDIYDLEIGHERILSGDITISNKCGEIEKPEGHELNVMDMKEDDWYSIMSEILYGMY